MLKTAFFFGVLGLWAFYIFMGDTALTRTYRTCHPIYLGMFELPNEVISRWDYDASVTWLKWGNMINNSCQYHVYKSIYGEKQMFSPESTNK